MLILKTLFYFKCLNFIKILHFLRWACGVIMFTLLVGCPPFWHRKQMVMLRNIMEGKYSFTSPEWADITGDILQKNDSVSLLHINDSYPYDPISN